MQDKLEKERADAKNFVEEYVYEMRDKIYTSLEKYVKEDDRAKFSKLLDDTENWLYEDGEDENKNVYVKKLEELKVSGLRQVERSLIKLLMAWVVVIPSEQFTTNLHFIKIEIYWRCFNQYNNDFWW